MSNLIDFIGRLLISALFLISAYNKIFSIDGTMGWMEGFGIPGFLLYPTIVIEIILPLFIIIGYQAKLSAGLLAIFCLATAFIFHFDFENQSETISFLKNIGLAGGFLFIVTNGTRDWSINRKKKYVKL
tara:strand:- start:1484 stop:1870 length:387 start_codon:yes stop_codon:yes gene_type:complete